MKNLALPGLILAVAVIIDFATVRHRPFIFERFYRWWLKLSALNLSAAGDRGVRWFSAAIDRVFGPRVFSIRSMLFGTLFVFGASLAIVSLPTNLVLAVVMSAAALVPGVVNFQGTRLLFHVLDKRVSFTRVLLFGLSSFLLVEITAILSYTSLGLLAAFLVKLAFNHHLALADAVPVSSLLLLFAILLVFVYLPVAIFPAVCCIFTWIVFVLLYASSRLGLWIRDFLADRIEQKWEAPFTVIGGVLAAFMTVVLWLSDFVSPREIAFFAINKQTALNSGSLYRATTFGTWTLIALSERKTELAKYYRDWASRLRSFSNKGIQTPEELGAALRVHLPNLARQWNSQIDAENQTPTSP